MRATILANDFTNDYEFDASHVTVLPSYVTLWDPEFVGNNYDEFRKWVDKGVMVVKSRLLIPTGLAVGVFIHDRQY